MRAITKHKYTLYAIFASAFGVTVASLVFIQNGTSVGVGLAILFAMAGFHLLIALQPSIKEVRDNERMLNDLSKHLRELEQQRRDFDGS